MKTKRLICSLALGFIVAEGVRSAQAQTIQNLASTLSSTAPATLLVLAQASAAGVGAEASPAAPTGALAPDFKPVFMAIATNYTLRTNIVIVTNYVVVTNTVLTTNFYNAQGQLMQLIGAGAPVQAGAAAAVAKTPAPPAGPDPMIRSNQVQALKDLLRWSATAGSNALSAEGAFNNSPTYRIRIPDGVTVLDRKKAQTLSTAMNTAAEKAAPEVFALVQKSIAQLNPPDPSTVLRGGNDGATRHLQSAEGQAIATQALTIVQRTGEAARVPEAYRNAMLKGGGLLGAVFGTGPAVDLDGVITRGLVEAVFQSLAAEENRLRADPAGKISKALQEALKR